MKKRKPSVVRLGVLCVLSACALPVHAETLLDIYQQALQNDHQLRAAAARAEAGREELGLGRAALLPNISGEAYWSDSSGTRAYEPGDDNPLTPGDESLTEPFDIDTESTGYSVGVSQTLINLSAWNQYQAGKSAAKAADYIYSSAEQQLVVRTSEAYFDALNAVDYLETARAEQEALSHQLEQTRQRFEVGLTAITEVHEAQAAYDSATANRLVAEGQLGIAFEALEVLTGESYNALAPLQDAFPVLPPEPLEREAWEAFAIENNPVLKTDWQNMQTAKANAAAAKAEHFPTLTAGASYHEDTLEGFNSYDEDGSRVQVTLNVPLFSGGAVSARRRQAYANYVAVRETYLQTKRDVVQNVRSNHLSVITTAATVKARRQAIVSNRSALEATQAGYDVGTRDLVDVLNAQRNLYTAQRDYYTALYDYVLSTLRLRQAAGILGGEQVAELNQWLNPDAPILYTRP